MYDTGFKYVAIPAKNCSECYQGSYDPSESLTYNTSDIIGESIYINSVEFPDPGALDGQWVNDIVCLSKDVVCVNKFNFFLIEEQIGLPADVSGILGLTRPISDSEKPNTNFLYQLG